jgi:lysophospholipase
MKITNTTLLAMQSGAALAIPASAPQSPDDMNTCGMTTLQHSYTAHLSPRDCLVPINPSPTKSSAYTSPTTSANATSTKAEPIATSTPLAYIPHIESPVDKTSLIRFQNTLSEEEADFLRMRKMKANGGLEGWMGDIFSFRPNVDMNSSDIPTLGLATSGGGVRSLLTTAGVLESLSRNTEPDVEWPYSYNLYNAISIFATDSTTSWLPFIMARSNYTLREYVDKVLAPQLEYDLFPDPKSLHLSQQKRLAQEMKAKEQNNVINTTMSAADMWSRVLAYKLFPGPDGQSNVSDTGLLDMTLSGLMLEKNAHGYKSAAQPLPILNMLVVKNNACMPTKNQTSFEVTPFESGTWRAEDSNTPFWFKTRYLDTQMGAVPRDLALAPPMLPSLSPIILPPGPPPPFSRLPHSRDSRKVDAVVGWDNIGLLAGISSFPINMVNCKTYHKNFPTQYREWADYYTNDDLPPYGRLNNPFYNSIEGSHFGKERTLRLVDGSESNHSMPLLSVLRPERGVDVVLAIDSSAGPDGYPDGSQMIAAGELARKLKSYRSRMPSMPKTVEQWRAQMPNRDPVVFGCNEPNATTIIYLPNKKMGDLETNFDEHKWKYSKEETKSMFDNGVNLGLQKNPHEWRKCLGCFIFKKKGLPFRDICDNCWNHFCYSEIEEGGSRWTQPSEPPFPRLLDGHDSTVRPDVRNPDTIQRPSSAAGSLSQPSLAAFVLFLAVIWSLL